MSVSAILIEYVIRRNERQGGVTLSRLGAWGNLPYKDADAASTAARANAGSSQYSIERQGC